MIVIADDITGAAEIAGIAFERGQQVRLVCGCTTATDRTATDAAAATYGTATDAVTVVATDTRSMTADEAAAETRRVAAPFANCIIFKKTDSALRGHVVEELTALMKTTGMRRAVYLPANPSKGRVIRNGVYYIKQENKQGEEEAIPIHETDFRFDPEFPARTSVLKERFPDAETHGILMPDAETADDIRRVIAQYGDGQTLFAGAADLFSAMLESSSISSLSSSSISFRLSGQSTLILCGSTQSRALDLGIPVAPMPRTIYDGADNLTLWDTSAYDVAHSLILSIPHTHRTGKAVAVHLRTVMAEMTKRLVARHRPDHLIIEGGATAWATLQALGWSAFEIKRQIAPGVVQMSATNGTLVTLKPGSYPWGGLFQSFSE